MGRTKINFLLVRSRYGYRSQNREDHQRTYRNHRGLKASGTPPLCQSKFNCVRPNLTQTTSRHGAKRLRAAWVQKGQSTNHERKTPHVKPRVATDHKPKSPEPVEKATESGWGQQINKARRGKKTGGGGGGMDAKKSRGATQDATAGENKEGKGHEKSQRSFSKKFSTLKKKDDGNFFLVLGKRLQPFFSQWTATRWTTKKNESGRWSKRQS